MMRLSVKGLSEMSVRGRGEADDFLGPVPPARSASIDIFVHQMTSNRRMTHLEPFPSRTAQPFTQSPHFPTPRKRMRDPHPIPEPSFFTYIRPQLFRDVRSCRMKVGERGVRFHVIGIETVGAASRVRARFSRREFG